MWLTTIVTPKKAPCNPECQHASLISNFHIAINDYIQLNVNICFRSVITDQLTKQIDKRSMSNHEKWITRDSKCIVHNDAGTMKRTWNISLDPAVTHWFKQGICISNQFNSKIAWCTYQPNQPLLSKWYSLRRMQSNWLDNCYNISTSIVASYFESVSQLMP